MLPATSGSSPLRLLSQVRHRYGPQAAAARAALPGFLAAWTRVPVHRVAFDGCRLRIYLHSAMDARKLVSVLGRGSIKTVNGSPEVVKLQQVTLEPFDQE